MNSPPNSGVVCSWPYGHPTGNNPWVYPLSIFVYWIHCLANVGHGFLAFHMFQIPYLLQLLCSRLSLSLTWKMSIVPILLTNSKLWAPHSTQISPPPKKWNFHSLRLEESLYLRRYLLLAGSQFLIPTATSSSSDVREVTLGTMATGFEIYVRSTENGW